MEVPRRQDVLAATSVDLRTRCSDKEFFNPDFGTVHFPHKDALSV